MSMTALTTVLDPRPAVATDTRNIGYQELKSRIHQDLLNRLNLDRLTRVKREDAEPEIRSLIGGMLDRERDTTPLSLYERESMVSDVLHELFGLGPLELLLHDPSVSDILVNRFDQIYVERNGRLEPTDITFKDERHLQQIIERIVSSIGRRIDESSPMVDARLADGSRVNAIIPPLALDGAVMSIRRFRTDKLGADDLVGRESWTEPMKEFLEAAVGCRLNVVVSGGTGAGKTTLLNILSSFIGDHERVVTIEDAAELKLRQRHVVRLETRPANIEGKGAVRAARSRRQRPAYAAGPHHRRRGPQRGSARHAPGHEHRPRRQLDDDPREHAARRAVSPRHDGRDGEPEHSGEGHPRSRSRRRSTWSCRVSRMADGTRKVTAISEVTGMEGEVITMQDIFLFERTGHRPGRPGARAVQGDRHPAEVRGTARRGRRAPAGGHVRTRQGHSVTREGTHGYRCTHVRRWFSRSSSARTSRSSFGRRRSSDRRCCKRLGKHDDRTGVLEASGSSSGRPSVSAASRLNAVLSRAKGVSGPLERLITQSGLKITVGTLVMASSLPRSSATCS